MKNQTGDKSIRIPKLTIGLVVYNGEPFTRKKLESLLAQTFTDFELIISDNASNDGTSEICEEYSRKDKRILYIRQQKNMGASWNYNFVLQEARCKYFTWTAVDDFMKPDFLEKNLDILEKNEDVVGSTGKVEFFHMDDDKLATDNVDRKLRDFRKKFISTFRENTTCSLTGSYRTRVRLLFKKSAYLVIYCVFRTDKLRQSIVYDSFVANDAARILSVLRHGNIHVIDEVLLKRFDEGVSTRGSIDQAQNFNEKFGLLGTIFPHYPFTLWCARNLGMKIFLQNIDHFIKLNIGSEFLVLVDLIRIILTKLKKTKTAPQQ